MFSRDQAVGLQGEIWVANQLREKGYDVRIPGRFDTQGCDLFADGLCLEVKIASPTIRWMSRTTTSPVPRIRWQWHIHKTSLAMIGDWAAVLVAEDTSAEKYTYIVPSAMIKNRTHLQLTSHPLAYSGWLAPFRGRWDVIDYLVNKRYRLWPDFLKWPGPGVENASRNKTSTNTIGSGGEV